MRRMKLSNGGIPGVFNCRFANPTVANPNRKKKKPTTFVPPPPPPPQPSTLMQNSIGDVRPRFNGNGGSRQLIPFWRRPLTMATSPTHNHQVLILSINKQLLNTRIMNLINFLIFFS